MKIHEKEKVMKFLEMLIKDVENVEYFNIKEYIDKFKDISEHEKSYLPFSIESLGKTYSLFENTLNSNEWFKLSKKGIEFKESGKILSEYEKSLKPKWYNENWIGFVIAFISLLFACFQFYLNQSLQKDLENLNKSYEILNTEHDSLNKKFSLLRINC